MFRPRADFWRVWARAFVCVALAAIACVIFLHQSHAEQVRASFYGAEMGHRTASGAPWRPMGLSAAHRTLPMGTRLWVCFRRCVTVVVNDRGPSRASGRSLDLSRGAARVIGLERVGVGVVTITRLN